MDIRMPVLDGIEATRRIVRAQPGTRVLILTTFGLDGYVYDALRAGASGFMLKDAAPGRSSRRPHRLHRRGAARAGGHAYGDRGVRTATAAVRPPCHRPFPS